MVKIYTNCIIIHTMNKPEFTPLLPLLFYHHSGYFHIFAIQIIKYIYAYRDTYKRINVYLFIYLCKDICTRIYIYKIYNYAYIIECLCFYFYNTVSQNLNCWVNRYGNISLREQNNKVTEGGPKLKLPFSSPTSSACLFTVT